MILKDLSKAAIITLILGFIAIILTTAMFLELAEDVLEKEIFMIDHFFQDYLVSDSNNWFYQMMEILTEAGSVLFLTVASVMVIAYLFLTKKSKWYILFLIVNMVGISLLTKVLKLLFERERPELIDQYDGTGFSFPSGHSTGAIAFYGFIIYLIWKKVSIKWVKFLALVLSGFLAVAIPLSRVVLGVHYFTDILAGMSLGLAWLITCLIALEFLLWRRKAKMRDT
ncbi:phosphatase PAP2 family protein [Gracilibacillus kekensis]|uniref:Undecaprenyl-diphosphatase n=1 Tax=Gracilibacillus kekensis TaxID=1027249 RepID=A0A1M7PYR3_9BACI|nr:phosphatase PAP2 family protein [Gracilibacillus kekensis]SHN22886.1 undecaprenyl-diphosphatase [Gracilibacillus kekensis]